MDEYLNELYFTPSLTSSFGGVNKLYKLAKKRFPEITLKYVKNWLIKQNAYTLHKQARRNFLRNKYYVSYIDEQWQCDLIDMQNFSRQNGGHKYILTIIDCFSKYLFAIPLKTKKSIETISAFKKLFKQRKPIKLQSDRGGEFDNNIFRRFMKNQNVTYFTTKDKLIKCAIIERANRTIKEKIFRYFTHKGTRKYIDVLQDLIDSYNNTQHRSTKYAPTEVNHSNEKYVFQELYGSKNLKELFFSGNNVKPKLKANDNVRLKYDLSRLDKSYYPLWTDKIYKVKSALNKYNKPQYIVSLDKIDQDRRYYPEELQKISESDDTYYRVEKIIKRRIFKGEEQVLVKWLNYPAKYNQWIPATHVIRLK